MAKPRKGRPVHYHGAGEKATFFECYVAELTAHLDSPLKPTEHRQERAYPAPLRSSNLNQVTCAECWQRIIELDPFRPRRWVRRRSWWKRSVAAMWGRR